MTPDGDAVIDTSSNNNPDDVDKLRVEDNDKWESEPGDENPTINVTVSSSDVFVDTVVLKGTENVRSVTVIITKTDGTEVCYIYA